MEESIHPEEAFFDYLRSMIPSELGGHSFIRSAPEDIFSLAAALLAQGDARYWQPRSWVDDENGNNVDFALCSVTWVDGEMPYIAHVRLNDDVAKDGWHAYSDGSTPVAAVGYAIAHALHDRLNDLTKGNGQN